MGPPVLITYLSFWRQVTWAQGFDPGQPRPTSPHAVFPNWRPELRKACVVGSDVVPPMWLHGAPWGRHGAPWNPMKPYEATWTPQGGPLGFIRPHDAHWCPLAPMRPHGDPMTVTGHQYSLQDMTRSASTSNTQYSLLKSDSSGT